MSPDTMDHSDSRLNKNMLAKATHSDQMFWGEF